MSEVISKTRTFGTPLAKLSPSTRWILAGWVLLVGSYTFVTFVVPPGPALTAFGDIAQCLVPLVATTGLLMNAVSPNRRKNAFWYLLALGCALWMAGQLLWTYNELGLLRPNPNTFLGNVVFFLHVVPMIAALALRPHAAQERSNPGVRWTDFTMLLVWWAYLYLFILVPWKYVAPDKAVYDHNLNVLYTAENLVFLAGLGVLWLRTSNGWRIVYAHLFGAAFLYTTDSLLINVAIDQGAYYTGSLYDIPLVASFVWFGTAGIIARRLILREEPTSVQRPKENVWQTRLAMAAFFSLPALACWSMFASTPSRPVGQFRLLITLVTIIGLSLLIFIRQHLVDQERLRLLGVLEKSVTNLKRLQTQLVQSEKLASLGQLAAGAAHEINNPLTAILGYSELLMDDHSAGEKARGVAAKIREQVLRTKALVTNLLSFARQVPAENAIVDLNAALGTAVELRTLDLRDKNVRIQLQTESVLPAVRGDPNQLLQVFFNIISNAVDAMQEVGGGVLTVRARREKDAVVIEFSDNGPGIREPDYVFDPFYTTKPVGKGTGLGLSICYGIVQEHGGHISCHNQPEGGACFRVELPAIQARLPRPATPTSPAAEPVGARSNRSLKAPLHRLDF